MLWVMKRLEANFTWIILCLRNNLHHTHICWVMKCPSVPHRKMACKSHAYTDQHVTVSAWSHNVGWFGWLMDCMYSTVHTECHWYSRNSAHATSLLQKRNKCFVFFFCSWQLKGWNNILPAISGLLAFCVTARVRFGVLSLAVFFSFRTFRMTTPRWSSTWMLLMVWWWRATCSRGPAMPLRPGTGN